MTDERTTPFTPNESEDQAQLVERPAATVAPVFAPDLPEREVHSQARADHDAGAAERLAQVEAFRGQSATAREIAAAAVEQAKRTAEDEDTIAETTQTRRAAERLDFLAP